MKAGLFVILAALLSVVLPVMAAHTNIVVIIADDLGWADIGYNNPTNVYTPTLDALASNGVTFAHHYVMSQCTPTRVALFTGRYPSRSGTQAQQASNNQSYPHGTLTLSSMLAAQGYECYMAGKWHMGSAPEWGPNHHGFDESYGSLAGAVGMYDHRYRPGDTYEITWHRNHEIIPGYENGVHATDLVANDAIRFVQQPHDKPFFMYLPFHAPHTPLDERGAFTNTPTQLDPTNSTRWLNEDLIPWFNDPAGKIQSEPDPEKRLLLATVYHLDSAISNVVAALDDAGLRDDTIIFFSSDNGPQVSWNGNSYPDDLKLSDFNQPDTWRGSKLDVYEGGTLVPGFANWPARIAPRVVTNPVHIVDWLPTIASMVGHTAAPEWDGEDIMPLIDGSGTLGDRTFYWLWGSGSTRWALRHGDWKIVRYGGEPTVATNWALFDLATDPREATNLASTATNKLEELHALFLVERDNDLKAKIVSPRLIGPGAATNSFSVQVKFTESVSGLALDDFVLVNAAGSVFSGSGSSYAFNVNPTLVSNGTVSVTLPAGGATASGGRNNAPSNLLEVDVEITPEDTPDITTGLISHYPFDVDAGNIVTGAPDGTLVGQAEIVGGGHQVGTGCLLLGGANGYVDVTTNGRPNHVDGLAEGSLSMWLNTTTAAWSAPIGTVNEGGDKTAFLYHINFAGTEDASRLLVRDRNDGAGSQQFDATLDVNDGAWHHVAVTWGPNQSDARMYLDGVSLAVTFPYSNKKSTSGGVFTAWEFPVLIGARNNRGTIQHHYQGHMDDVRIYDRVLEDADVDALAAMVPAMTATLFVVR